MATITSPSSTLRAGRLDSSPAPGYADTLNAL